MTRRAVEGAEETTEENSESVVISVSWTALLVAVFWPAGVKPFSASTGGWADAIAG